MQHLIDRIEVLKANILQFTQANNLKHFSSFSDDLKNLTLAEFIAVCEHYGASPSVSQWPTAWIELEGCNIGIGVKDDVKIPVPKINGLELLRSAMAQPVAA